MEFEALRAEIGYKPSDSLKIRQETIYGYLDSLDEGNTSMAETIAEDILASGSPLSNTVVIIPVAAHQEAPRIAHTMAEYARQEPSEPFSIILGLNSPVDKYDSDGVQATLDSVEQSQEAHPYLDIRSTLVHYDEPVIGEIRRDLWNGVAVASKQTGNFEAGPEVVGINHDIDLVSLAGTCIAQVQGAYAKRDQWSVITPTSPPFGTRVRHAYSAEHPNISKAVMWSDFVHRQAEAPYEAGIVIPMSFYARHGGFNRHARTHEIGGLTTYATLPPKVLRGTNTQTSPRRYIARMDKNGYNIWREADFTAQDECRERDDYPDIRWYRRNEIIYDSLPLYVRVLMNGVAERASDDFWTVDKEARFQKVDYKMFRGFIERRVEKAGRLAGFMLDRTIESPALNKELGKLFNDKAVVSFLAEYFRHEELIYKDSK